MVAEPVKKQVLDRLFNLFLIQRLCLIQSRDKTALEAGACHHMSLLALYSDIISCLIFITNSGIFDS